MAHLTHWFRLSRVAGTGLVAGLMACTAFGQTGVDSPPVQPRVFVRSGYTRPGNPPDELKADGSVKPVALEPGFKGIGGTIYFAVIELGDAFGEGRGPLFKSLDGAFVPGTFVAGGRPGSAVAQVTNRSSGKLDRSARYLYLYQVVNDRGLDRSVTKVQGAANREIDSQDIECARLRLLVRPHLLTSWGYFRNLGFAFDVSEQKGAGGIKFAALGDEGKFIRMAASSNPAVTEGLPSKAYLLSARAYPLGNVLHVDKSTVGLKESVLVKELTENGKDSNVKLASYQEGMLKAAGNASAPDSVQIVLAGFEDNMGFRAGMDELTQGASSGPSVVPAFRAVWKDKNALKLGEHSTLFGFTSNLPPVDTEIRIRDPRLAAVEGDGPVPSSASVAPAGLTASAAGTANGAAPGTVPTPFEVGAMFASPALEVGSLGGQPQGFGGGLSVPPIAAGVGRPSVATGSPTSGGSGGGSGQLNGSQSQQQPINISPVISVQQSQQQGQGQSQSQQQSQSQHSNGNVVPEPPAYLLALLGLPMLLVLRRLKAAPVAA